MIKERIDDQNDDNKFVKPQYILEEHLDYNHNDYKDNDVDNFFKNIALVHFWILLL